MSDETEQVIKDLYREMFDALYCDLRKAFPHPLEWRGLLHRPKWWQRRKMKAHMKVAAIFASYGLILDDCHAFRFDMTPPQRFDEDCGGSFVRRLRETFQHQTGVAYYD